MADPAPQESIRSQHLQSRRTKRLVLVGKDSENSARWQAEWLAGYDSGVLQISLQFKNRAGEKMSADFLFGFTVETLVDFAQAAVGDVSVDLGGSHR